MNKIKNIILVMLSLFMLTSISYANDAETEIRGALKEASKVRKLNKSNAMVAFAPNGEAVVISDNPRWVIKGTLYDMWQNKEIRNEETLNDFESKIPFNNLNKYADELLDAWINIDKDKELIIILDPSDHKTPNVIDITRKFITEYKVRYVFTAMDNNNIAGLLGFSCQVENKSSEEILDIASKGLFQESDTPCLEAKVMQTYGLIAFMGIQESPTLIASNHKYHVGMPSSLMTWLKENME